MNPRILAGRAVAVISLAFGLFIFSAAAQTPNPVGEWNLQSDAQGQITKFTLTVTKEGDALKGKVVSETYGSQDLNDLKFENGSLTFTRNLEIGGQAVAMAFKGKIEGDKLTGNYSLEGFDIPVTGSRKTPSPPPANSPSK
jgi:hypothetical protein